MADLQFIYLVQCGGHPGPFELCGYGLGSRSVLERLFFWELTVGNHMAGSVASVVRVICQLVFHWILCDLWVLAFRVYCHPGPFRDLTANHCIQLWGSWELWWRCAYCPNKKCNKEIWYTTACLIVFFVSDWSEWIWQIHQSFSLGSMIYSILLLDEMSKDLAGSFWLLVKGNICCISSYMNIIYHHIIIYCMYIYIFYL